jgi:hypothetical protein
VLKFREILKAPNNSFQSALVKIVSLSLTMLAGAMELDNIVHYQISNFLNIVGIGKG